ncbi:GGDEF domain-containing protein [Marinobacterium sp. 3-1745]|uniref:diguanylate cyclase n=1 Tax=Marinobacterium marinum TaxID=2756129 RepID=A0A7W2AAS9_9GAMM|nr:GGDEF domain-containing protein [Marinobacterium marinum]
MQWTNPAFDALPKDDRHQVEHWGQDESAGILICAGTLFERLIAGDHTLVIASGHRAAQQQRQLMQALIPQLQQGANPFFALPKILCELLGWNSSAACTRLNTEQIALVGHWHNQAQHSPRTLELSASLAAPLYAGHTSTPQVQEWNQTTTDPLLPEKGIWLGQSVQDAEGTIVGHLALWDTEPQTSLADSIHLLQLSADLVGAWLPPKPADEEPQTFSTDPLTHLLQRDALDHALIRSEKQHPEHDYLLALIDIDGLSQINHELGQQEGDRILCTFAAKLQQICRPNDQIFRFGGDEFVLLIPVGKQPPPLAKRLDQINRSMAEQLKLPFHASAGLALMSEVHGNSDELMLLTNSRLQQTKAQN